MVAPRYWYVCFVLPPQVRGGDKSEWLYDWADKEAWTARKRFWHLATGSEPPAGCSLWRWGPVDGWSHVETVSDDGDSLELADAVSSYPSQALSHAMLAAVWNIMQSLDGPTFIAPFETIGEIGGVS